MLLSEAAASFRAQADAAGVELTVNVAPDLPLMELDPERIREVLGNLLSNGLRHTARGGALAITAEPAEEKNVRVTVADTGAGIPPEALPRVFDRFYKSADSDGSGLGLAIAKNLVTAHGGEITAESDGVPGQGTTIKFTLPL